MLLIAFHELEYRPFDISSSEALPTLYIEPVFNLRTPQESKRTISADLVANSSFAAHNQSSAAPHNDSAYRSRQDKLIAFQRYLSGTGQIIIIHLRKAGGTTLETWLKEINRRLAADWNAAHPASQRWNSTVTVREAYHFFHKMAENNITHSMLRDPHSIYVTAMRHPIERILSQYEFEWRWACQRCDHRDALRLYAHANMTDWTFMARAERMSEHEAAAKRYDARKYAAVDFNDWLHRLVRFEVENAQLGDKGHAMQSVRAMYINNYVLWVACCSSRWCNIERDYTEAQAATCFKKTVRILKSFDVLLVTEWINDLRTQLYVNRLFFEDAEVGDEKRFVGVEAVNRPYPHHVVSKGKNYMISPENEEALYRLNAWDLKVYQTAKRIVFDRVHAVWQDVFDDEDGSAFNRLLDAPRVEDILAVEDDVRGVFNPYRDVRH